MTKKQKLTLTICAILMALVIAGLSVAIVLVASQANITAQMTVTFTSYNVSASIECKGYIVDMTNDAINGEVVQNVAHPTINTPQDGIVEFVASDAQSQEEVEFNEINYSNSKYRVRFEFNITNNGTKTMMVECEASAMGSKDSNMETYLRNYTDNVNQDASGNLSSFKVKGGNSKTVYFFVYVDDPAIDGYFEGGENGSLGITLTGLDEI